jgi:hypothetical protein
VEGATSLSDFCEVFLKFIIKYDKSRDWNQFQTFDVKNPGPIGNMERMGTFLSQTAIAFPAISVGVWNLRSEAPF